MTRYLHTMYRITDPEKSRAFYEALGFEFRRELPIVRDGELEATNYFFGIPGQEEELELTFNHDGRTYELGTGYGHIALAVDLDGTLAELQQQGIEPERPPYRVRAGGSRLCFVRHPHGSSGGSRSTSGELGRVVRKIAGGESGALVRELRGERDKAQRVAT